jgi:hypothetical protein
MAAIIVMAVFIGSVLAAALSSLCVDEFKAWLPWAINFFIERAVASLPEDSRERYAEEWRSHVSEIPGAVGKLIAAVSLLWAAHTMSSCLSRGRGVYIRDKYSKAALIEELTRKKLATLTPREEQILRMRFGIGQKREYTVEEIAEQFADTRERILQFEDHALRKLLPRSRVRALKSTLPPK